MSVNRRLAKRFDCHDKSHWTQSSCILLECANCVFTDTGNLLSWIWCPNRKNYFVERNFSVWKTHLMWQNLKFWFESQMLDIWVSTLPLWAQPTLLCVLSKSFVLYDLQQNFFFLWITKVKEKAKKSTCNATSIAATRRTVWCQRWVIYTLHDLQQTQLKPSK